MLRKKLLALAAFDRCHGEPFAGELLVVELRLLERAAPDLSRALAIHLMGKVPSPFCPHAGNNLAETVDHVLKGVDVVVQHDHPRLRVPLGGA